MSCHKTLNIFDVSSYLKTTKQKPVSAPLSQNTDKSKAFFSKSLVNRRIKAHVLFILRFINPFCWIPVPDLEAGSEIKRILEPEL